MKNSNIQEERFLAVLESHKKIVFKIANSYCQNTEDRKDLVQEIVLQLWRAFPKYDPQYAMSTWIYRISLNVSISYYRKERKRKKAIVSNWDSIIELEDDLEKEQLTDDIKLMHEFIAQLNPLDKALIILYLEGNKYEDMSHILGISKTNVATKISRIKQKLSHKFKMIKK